MIKKIWLLLAAALAAFLLAAPAQAQSTRSQLTTNYLNPCVVANTMGLISQSCAYTLFQNEIQSFGTLADTNAWTGLNTFADSGSWSSSGIGSAKALGVGETAPSAGNINIAGQYQIGGSPLNFSNLAGNVTTSQGGLYGATLNAIPYGGGAGTLPGFLGPTANSVVSWNGSSVIAALGYTSANTPSTLVARDASGNFSAGTISPQSISYTGTGSLSTLILNVNQSFSGSVAANFQALEIQMNDAIASGTNFVYPMAIYETLNSSSVTGSRPGLTSEIIFNAATGNLSGGEYVGGSFVFEGGASDNGTIGTAAGFGNGANPKCELNSGATNWAGCIGMVSDAIIHTGASARRRISVQAEGGGNVSGSALDAAFDVEVEQGTGQPFTFGLLFDDSTGVNANTGGTYPIAASGTLIMGGFSSGNSVNLHAGIDFTQLNGTWQTFNGVPGDAIVLPITNSSGITWGTSGARVYSTATNAGGGGTVVLSNGKTSLTAGGVTVHVDSNGFAFDYAGTTSCTVTASIQVTINGSIHKIPYC